MKSNLKKHKKLIWVIGILLMVILIIGIQKVWSNRRRMEAMQFMQQETATLERRTLLESISATGTIASVASKEISANVSGIEVESILVAVGDRVEEGDLLCVLDAETIEQNLADTKASYEVAQKKTQLELAAAERSLAEAQTSATIDATRAAENVSDSWNDYLETVTDAEEAEAEWNEALETEYEKKGEYELRLELLAKCKEELEAAKAVAEQSDASKFESQFTLSREQLDEYIKDNGIVANGLMDNIYLSNGNLASLNSDQITSGSDGSGDLDSHKAKVAEDLALLVSLQSQYNQATQADQAYAAAQSAYQSMEQETSTWKSKYEAAANSTKSMESAYEQALNSSESMKDSYDKQVQNKEDTERNNTSTLANKTDSLTTTQLNASIQGLSDEQKIAEYEKQIAACQVKAPFSGIITSISVEEGDSYNGGVIVTIEDDSAFEVSAQIDEYDISKISVGQNAVIKTNATGDTELSGTVKSVAPRATQGSTDVTYEVIVSIDEVCDSLRMDMTAQMSIILSQVENVLTVPYDALQEQEDGTYYIEVVRENQEANYQNDSATPKDMEQPEHNMQDKMQDKMQDNMQQAQSTERITVEKGVESDYYVQVSGAGLTEGMEVVIPQSKEQDNNMQNRIMMQGPMGGF